MKENLNSRLYQISLVINKAFLKRTVEGINAFQSRLKNEALLIPEQQQKVLFKGEEDESTENLKEHWAH